MRYDSRVPTSLLALAAALLTSACGSPPPAAVHFAEFVPFAQGGISTDAVIPAMGATDPLLGEGWAPSSEVDASDSSGYWVYGHDAEFRFFAAVHGDLTLELQALPHSPPGAPAQVAYIFLNGVDLGPLPLRPGMRDYEVTLPGEHLVDGWNRVRMQFRHALRPSEVDENNRDTRPLAARFRRVLLRSPLNRPLWPDRPEEIGLSNPGESIDDAMIEMPTDSVMDVLIAIDEGQQLVGAVDFSFAGPTTSAEIDAAVELIDSSSTAHELFSYQFTDEPRSPESIQVDLSEWAGKLVQIRLRAWGSANAIIHWRGLGLTASPVANGGVAPGGSELADSTGRGRLVRGDEQTAGPDIIFIMLDAARADAFLGPDHPPATPNVDALARESTHFGTTWAPSSWTGQSVPAMFTGQSPDSVGAEVWGSQLPETSPTLAELLSGAGYHTVVWSQHNVYRGNKSLRRGFEVFEEVRSNVQEDRLLLPGADALFVEDRPTFAMIHLLPPHTPYLPPEPFRGRLSSWYTGDFEVTARNLNRLRNDPPSDQAELEEIARYAHDRYLENVEFADQLVGRLVEMLKGAGRYDNALVVLFADHGEAFFEHGRYLHTTSLYEEFLRVPLFLKWPGYMSGFAQAVDQPVTLLDLAPTLIDGLGIEPGPVEYVGRSLIPLAFDGVEYRRDLYAYTRGRVAFSEGEAAVYAYRSGPYKVLYSDTLDLLELYNLEEDPGERNDLSSVEPLRARYMAQQAMLQKRDNLALLARLGPEQIEALDEETLRQLRALGYIQ
jgi:arylsulfatase A-like enzyme